MNVHRTAEPIFRKTDFSIKIPSPYSAVEFRSKIAPCQFSIFKLQLLIALLFSTPLLGNQLEIKDLDCSLIPDICAKYDGHSYSKAETLKILKSYLMFFNGDPKDPETVKNYTASALDQYFSFKALFELSRNDGCAADIDEARNLYENYSSKQSPSKLIEELSLLRLNKEEIIRSIYEKQSVQNYRIKILKSIQIGEAEAMLFYHEKPEKFIQKAGRYSRIFQIEKELSMQTIKELNKLIVQGISAETALENKNIEVLALPKLFIESQTQSSSPFRSLIDAETGKFTQITTASGPLLTIPEAFRKESKIDFFKVSDKIVESLKNHKLKKILGTNISNHLEIKRFKNLINK
jgi:hypothetical protein